MKTYILNLSRDIKNWSNTLDATTIICSKSWLVFNEEGKKEVFIFRKDGSLIISVDGKVSRASWEYLAVNSSLLISTEDGETFMLNPILYDNRVFTLQLDGTNEYSFLIDQQEVERLCLNTLESLNLYINNNDEFEKRLASQRVKEYEDEREAKKEWEQDIRNRLDEWKKSPKTKDRIANIKYYQNLFGVCALFSFLFFILSLFYIETSVIGVFGAFVFILLFIISVVGLLKNDPADLISNKFEKLKSEHPFIYKE